MQITAIVCLAGLFAVCGASQAEGDRTITKVVKALQEMLDKSKQEGDSERELYAKYKCYCDTNELEKKASIESLTKQIGTLEAKIDEIQASTGGLSEEVAELRADMTENEQARETAEAIRKKEKAAFVALELDLTGAIEQMHEAIKTLSEIGADQTMSVGADHKQFMAKGEGLLSVKSSVQKALVAASALVNEKQRRTVQSFIQAPFTATYTAQSGEVVGILKDMRDTFSANLASAQASEKIAAVAHDKYMATKLDEYNKMSASLDSKQQRLGDNDGDLATKKTQLEEAETQLAADEEFLAKLQDMCAVKAKDYEKRNVLRANEEVALAEAISILNSDAAFASFGKVSASKTGATGFLQQRAIHRHIQHGDEQLVKSLLLAAGGKSHSLMLAKVVALVRAGNPFETVLKEIQKMIKLMEEEGEADKDQLDWCNSERTENKASHLEKSDQLVSLNASIAELTNTIEAPETGLKAQIESTETKLTENDEAQKTETTARTEANILYQKDIANLVEAERILKKAISVLKAYYSQFDLLQRKEDPAPPTTWENDSYKGQSTAATGAIGMLEFIVTNTNKEETEAHDDEQYAQHSYEDSMTDLKTEQAQLEKTIADLRVQLAAAEKELLEKKESYKATMADKVAIEVYLEKIKPGCDFITANFDLREANRKTETDAMNNAITLIKGTPAYLTAVAEAHVDSLGDCAETCKEHGEAHVECKACLAKVTIPGYCAGHADTEGCQASA